MAGIQAAEIIRKQSEDNNLTRFPHILLTG
jgi:hypothetical protein